MNRGPLDDERHELARDVEPPSQPMPLGFWQTISDIEASGTEYRTDCAMALLDLSYRARENTVGRIGRMTELTESDGGHTMSAVVGDGQCPGQPG